MSDDQGARRPPSAQTKLGAAVSGGVVAGVSQAMTQPVMGLIGTAGQIANVGAITIIASLFLFQYFDQREAARADRVAIARAHDESIEERRLCREAVTKVQEAADRQARALEKLAVGVRKLAEDLEKQKSSRK